MGRLRPVRQVAAAARRERFTMVAGSVEALPAMHYRTSFSRAHTRGTIRRLYRDLLVATGADDAGAGPPPTPGGGIWFR